MCQESEVPFGESEGLENSPLTRTRSTRAAKMLIVVRSPFVTSGILTVYGGPTMKRRNVLARILKMLLATAYLALVAPSSVSADDDSPSTKPTDTDQASAEARIWALEQAYWEFNRDAKQEQIIATWHDRFLGWPEGESKPIDKKEGARFVRENYAQPASYTFEIERTGIRVLGDVAVNHYAVHRKWQDGKQRSMRITHTWVREKNGWKVLGGMSASP